MMDRINLRKPLLLCATVSAVCSIVICLAVSAVNTGKLSEQQAKLETLSQELGTLRDSLSPQPAQAQLAGLDKLEQEVARLSTRHEQLSTQCDALKTLSEAPLQTIAAIQHTLDDLRAQNAQLMADSQTSRRSAALPLRRLDELSAKIEQLQMDVAYLYAESNASRQHLIALQNMLLQHSSEAHRADNSSSGSDHINWGDKGDLLKAGYKLLRGKAGDIVDGVQDFVDQQRADSLTFPAQ